MRPSAKVIPTEYETAVKNINPHLLLSDKNNINYRGNSAIYINIFEKDLNNAFADADKQAAINIALKGIFKELTIVRKQIDSNKDEESGIDYMEQEKQFQEYYKRVNIENKS